MKIIRLDINNFKGVVNAAIVPSLDGSVVTLAGNNGSGKSSALDAIWAALEWSAASKQIGMPIHTGADQASVTVDIGDYKVTRKWRKTAEGENTTALEVRNAQGHKLSPPQKILDDIVGSLSFDPSAFLWMKPAEQRDSLLAVLGLGGPMSVIEANRDEAYKKRTAAARIVRDKEGALANMAAPAADQSREEFSPSKLLEELREAQDKSAAIAVAQQKVRDCESEVERCEAEQKRLLAEVQRVQSLKDQALDLLAAAKEAPELQRPAPDLDNLKLRMDALGGINAKVKEAQEYDRIAGERMEAAALVDRLNGEIKAFDDEKTALLAAAEFPVENLSIQDGEIRIAGIPLGDCSTAEKWRIVSAIAMSGNPNLRIIRISDGSLLDENSMAILAALAESHDFQVWIEVVGQGHDEAVIFQEGRLAV